MEMLAILEVLEGRGSHEVIMWLLQIINGEYPMGFWLLILIAVRGDI